MAKIYLLDTKTHIRDNFECEEGLLTDYLKRQANQDVQKSLAACYVYINAQNHIIGYYTLSSDKIPLNEVPDEHKRKIPKTYGVPVTLLGRLARDISAKGSGLGEVLLMDALNRCYSTSSVIGSMAVIADPISDNAVKFYLKYGFIHLQGSGKMFITMKTIEKAFI